MKTLKLVLLTIGLIFLISCNKEETEINSNLIIGGWELEEVSFNNIDGTEISDSISNSTYLNFDDNKSYYRNYVSGNWSVSEMQLKLVPVEGLKLDDWNYEILQLTENTLKIKIELTEAEYCCDFESFESTDILTIIETYKKSE